MDSSSGSRPGGGLQVASNSSRSCRRHPRGANDAPNLFASTVRASTSIDTPWGLLPRWAKLRMRCAMTPLKSYISGKQSKGLEGSKPAESMQSVQRKGLPIEVNRTGRTRPRARGRRHMPLWSKAPSHELVTQMPTSFQEESPGTPQPQHEMPLESRRLFSPQCVRRIGRIEHTRDKGPIEGTSVLRTAESIVMP